VQSTWFGKPNEIPAVSFASCLFNMRIKVGRHRTKINRFNGCDKNFAWSAKFFGFAPARPKHFHPVVATAFGTHAFHREGFLHFDLIEKVFFSF
jgi:hypothetical protein